MRFHSIPTFAISNSITDNSLELHMEMMRNNSSEIPLLTFFLQSGYFEKAEFLRFQISALKTQRKRFLADKMRAEQLYGKRKHLVKRTASRWHSTIVSEYFKIWRTWSRRRINQRRKINRLVWKTVLQVQNRKQYLHLPVPSDLLYSGSLSLVTILTSRFLQRWRDDPLPRVFSACKF